jgi:hypothetical protein
MVVIAVSLIVVWAVTVAIIIMKVALRWRITIAVMVTVVAIRVVVIIRMVVIVRVVLNDDFFVVVIFAVFGEVTIGIGEHHCTDTHCEGGE